MAKLQPAGLVGKIASFLFPRKLQVEVRTEQCSDGTIEFKPVYSIDGKDIEASLIAPLPQQTVLGYKIEVNDHTLSICRRGTTRVTKRKAAEYLKDMQQRGIQVRHRGSLASPSLTEVKPDVTLTLNADDSLEVTSTLATAHGEIVEKPANLDQLRQDDGWFLAGDDLVHVETTDKPLDDTLLTQAGQTHFTGNSVPDILKEINASKGRLGHIEKSDNLTNLGIYGNKTQQQLRVDGNAVAIHVRPRLVWLAENSEYELQPEDVSVLQGAPPGYRRIPEGWIEIDPKRIADYQKAASHFDDLEHIEGTRIPETLVRLLRLEQQHSPWVVYFSQAVKNAHRVIDTPAKVEFKLNVVDRDGRSLLELDPIYNHERFQLNHPETEEAVANADNWIRRRDAWVRIDREKLKRISQAADELKLQRGPTGFAFPASQRDQVLQVFSVLGSIEHSQAYSDFLLKLADFDKIEDTPLPLSLRNGIDLYSYQKHGYNWLAFLHRFGLNGILADDMGLGKTLQTLAVIQRAKEQQSAMHPSLIICPTSVLRNWEAEVQKFFSSAIVIIYSGNRRDAKYRLIHEMLAYSHAHRDHPTIIVVTSYDIARRDCEQLNRFPWSYVVVDEGHNIKNPDAQRTKAIKTINGQHKLALTGTPIQNNLEELWSLFDFVMPNYLGTRNAFRQLYGRNGRIDWNAVRDNLKERLHPFIMRRLKEDVATELPPKIVIDQKLELTPIQVELYKTCLESADCKRVVAEIDAIGVQRSKVLILSVFTKLRAICNHPALAHERYAGKGMKSEDSCKLDCLHELMEEIIEGQHRALLFCQSTRMLDIIEQFFSTWEFTYQRLDGQTPAGSRQALVNEFNGNEAINCFLISTKAGGTGLNLTGADTVIFYDHDWNPANDNQAQDRAYRIGQTKPVTVYKLISKGTIEDKIIERQAAKQTLADEIIGSDEHGFKDLTRDELLTLFRLDEFDN